jgi:serine acetyltransferase/GT2 family glycosyltransferase
MIRAPSIPDVSVVIAVYNRVASVGQLLGQLAAQSMPSDRYEVVLVDDGSTTAIADAIDVSAHACAITVLRQENAGPAAARHRGIQAARGALIVVLDDDMRVGPDFLAAHLRAHTGDVDTVVLGRLRTPIDHPLRLFERFQLALLDRLAQTVAADPSALHGSHLYSGNVSFPRALYDRVGGFDPAFRLSEDAELGIRFERAGARFVLADDALAEHASDHTSTTRWIARSLAYGEADSRVALKHPAVPSAHPWRFLFLVNPLSRGLLVLAALAPWLGVLLARGALAVSQGVSAVGLERLAMAGTTLAYGLLYYAGVRRAAGSRRATFAALRRYLVVERPDALRPMGLIAKCWADIRADHDALHASDAKYRAGARRSGLLGDAIQRIGFQLLIAYRVMRLARQLRLRLCARVLSRAMRHLYAVDIHWDAELAPGIVVVHGIGLVISHAARVESGCILFHGVTLGESIHPVSRRVGAPTIESGVHLAVGAVIVGPIVIGAGSKVAAHAVVTESVPPRSLVESPRAVVRTRSRDAGDMGDGSLPAADETDGVSDGRGDDDVSRGAVPGTQAEH